MPSLPRGGRCRGEAGVITGNFNFLGVKTLSMPSNVVFLACVAFILLFVVVYHAAVVKDLPCRHQAFVNTH
jgi:hypothetical protein